MWRAVTDAVGIAARDALWDYPDIMPLASDIDDPSALIARLEALQRGETPETDELDEALARLLDGEDFGAADTDAADGGAADTGDTAAPGGEDEPGDDRPEGDRPV